MQPLISIIIPCYYADEFLEEALQSIKNQTYMNWEVILVEDGSKDRAEEILFAFNQSFTQKIFSIQGIMLI